MDSPLQLLRELLPFGPPNADQRTYTAVRNQLETLSDLTPQEVVVKLTSSVLPHVGQQSNLHMRFKLLEDIRHEAESAVPHLESAINRAVLPLPMDATSGALHVDNLLKSLTVAYSNIAKAISKHHLNGAHTHLYYRCIQRAMALIGRRQLLAYRAYALPSTSSWQTLHELYQMARGPLTKPLDGETAQIEHEYLGALLFAFLEPGKLPRNELEQVNLCARQLAAYALIGEATVDLPHGKAGDAHFIVRPDEGMPGYPLLRLPSGKSTFGSYLVDCTQVLAALDRNLTRRPGKIVEPDLDAPPALLQNLRIAIGGKSARRYSRTRFRPRGDLVSGFRQVISFLDGNTFSRRAVDAASRYEGRDFSTSEWALVDESPDGFLVRFIKGEKNNLGSGDVVALQPRESSKIHVCLVRRIASSNTRLELGLQLMSPQVSVVEIIAEGVSDDQRAIFMHSLPAYGKFSGLVVPPGICRQGQIVLLKLPGRALRRRIGNCMESNEGLEFFALDISD